MKLAGNTVLITGGSSGIGLALAEAFLAAGSMVGICARSADRLEAATAEHPALRATVCDVSSEADRANLLAWAAVELPGLNLLINNAGVQRDIDFTQGLGEFLAGENEIRINLEATILLSGLFIPTLATAASAAIVNVSSGLGFAPMARMPVYAAAKAGVHAFSLALRRQLAKTAIKVFEIVPPAVDTALNPEGRAKRGNFKAGVTAEEFIAAVMPALAEDRFEIGYGTSAGLLRASRDELDARFEMVNR